LGRRSAVARATGGGAVHGTDPSMKYPLVFGSTAGVAAVFAWFLPWWLAVPCWWFAASPLLASAAYARFGAGVLGKREDGEIPLWSLLLNGPFLVLGLVSMRVFHFGGSEVPWSEVAPGVFLGRRPSSADSERFRALGITAILDLCAELPATRARTGRERYLSLPVLDYQAPTSAQIQQGVEWIEAHRGAGRVFVHCALGRSRSAAIVAAWKLASAPPEALGSVEGELRLLHPPVSLMPSQKAALEQWQRQRLGL
jgi:hypothetical protein